MAKSLIYQRADMLKMILNRLKNTQIVEPSIKIENADVQPMLNPSSPIEQHLSHIEPPNAQSVTAFLTQLQKSEYLEKCESVFNHYPEQSLLSGKSRAILYSLTRFLKPNHVLEIGTYRAGSSEIIVRAMLQNSKGILTTIDPFGQERIPSILATWTPSFKNHINFLPLSSMDCFIKLGDNYRFEIIFVDGDHSYEHALYDLQMAMRYVTPGGVVIMDNAEQTGVYWAVKSLLSVYPDWCELGSSLAKHDIRNPYDTMTSSIPGTSFLILQAPDRIFVHQHPRSFEIKNVPEAGLVGFDFFFKGEQKDGYINALIFFRSFMHGGKPGIEQQNCIERFPIAAGSTIHRILFSKPFITSLDPADSYRTYEIVMTYISNEGDGFLEMTSAPVPIKTAY